MVADLDAAGGAETVDLVTHVGSQAELVVADISTLAGATEAVDHAVERFGGLDILVNNAGIAQGTERDTWDCDEEVWDRVLQVNLKSVYACTKAAVPHLRARAASGAIVSVASIAASVLRGRRGVRGIEGRDHQLHPPRLARARGAEHPRQLRVARLHAHADVHRRTTPA